MYSGCCVGIGVETMTIHFVCGLSGIECVDEVSIGSAIPGSGTEREGIVFMEFTFEIRAVTVSRVHVVKRWIHECERS